MNTYNGTKRVARQKTDGVRELRHNEVANAATAGGAASSAATLSTYVCRLEVAVQDVVVVHGLHTQAHLDEVRPHRRLRQVARTPLVLEQLEQISIHGELGDDVQDVLLDESLIERDDVLARDGGEDTNLVDSLGALLGRHLPRVYLLDRVDLPIRLTASLIHCAESPLAQEFEELEPVDLAKWPARGRYNRHALGPATMRDEADPCQTSGGFPALRDPCAAAPSSQLLQTGKPRRVERLDRSYC
jgi:hypothetical protein